MSKRTVSVIFIFLFVGVNAICGSEAVFSREEKEKIALIAKVKKFATSIGLKPTNNFKEYQDEPGKYNLLFFSKKTDVPYSYIDPLLNYKQSDYNNLASSVLAYDIDLNTYDVYFYTTLGIASGSYITKNLLKCEDALIADVVLHEDMHDNTNLPRQIDEGTAFIVGIAGSAMFMKSDEMDFICLMEYLIAEAEKIKSLHFNITEMNKTYKSGKMSFATYLTIRDYKMRVTGQDSMASVAQNHTYMCYVPLLLRLFRSMDYDIKRFISFMKDFPYKEPSWEQEHLSYFKETLAIEVEAKKYLEDKILEFEGTGIKENFSFLGYREHFFSSIDMIYLLNSFERIKNLTYLRRMKFLRK